MLACRECGNNPAARAIGLCVDCIRGREDVELFSAIHLPSREKFGLAPVPPRREGGKGCRLCANRCVIGEGEAGFCGLRLNRGGRIVDRAPRGSAYAHTYLDGLPTNCCSAWFCRGSTKKGYNLAVFFYGCNFDCLFCQNASHKLLREAAPLTVDEMVHAALEPHVRCVCFFGGSPEPQLPFALRVSRRIIDESENSRHICWEWNGCGNSVLVMKAAECASISGGTVKFDLKAFHPSLARALCGVDNRRSFTNFAMVAEAFPQRDLLTATTLLVPYYVDGKEVEEIARFIAGIDPEIPYSLLVFHPDYYLDDLPVTPRKQVETCYAAARRHLNRVKIGNMDLLDLSG